MADAVSADSAIPNQFLQLTAVLSDGEQLLGQIAPEQRVEQVAKALDCFTSAKGLLAQLQSAVNVLKGGNPPPEPDPANDVGRGATDPPEVLDLSKIADIPVLPEPDWQRQFQDEVNQEIEARTLLADRQVASSRLAVHALSINDSGSTLCGVRWVGRAEIRLGGLTPDNPNNPHGTVTCRFCRKAAMDR